MSIHQANLILEAQAKAAARKKDWKRQDELANQRRRNINREYLACADFCPVCGVDDIEQADLGPSGTNFDGPTGWVNIRCNVCESTWVDLYTMGGYEIKQNNYDPTDVMSPAFSPMKN